MHRHRSSLWVQIKCCVVGFVYKLFCFKLIFQNRTNEGRFNVQSAAATKGRHSDQIKSRLIRTHTLLAAAFATRFINKVYSLIGKKVDLFSIHFVAVAFIHGHTQQQNNGWSIFLKALLQHCRPITSACLFLASQFLLNSLS